MRKGQKTRLQTDQKFKQKKIFDLNKKINVDIFSTAVRGGKAFALEQKLRELLRENPHEIIRKSVENINSLPSAKINKHQMRLKKIH